MSLDTVALIAQLISSIVIVLTLLYLAKQTRQTNVALLANSRQTTMTTDVDFLLRMMAYPEVNWQPHEGDVQEMPADRVAASRATVAFIRIREFAWFQYQSGILDEAAWRSIMAPTSRVLSSEIGGETWDTFRSELDPGFVEYCDRLAHP